MLAAQMYGVVCVSPLSRRHFTSELEDMKDKSLATSNKVGLWFYSMCGGNGPLCGGTL